MGDSSGFIGSMPSIPPPKPQIRVPTQTAGETNLGAAIGFLFWSICLPTFPTYAQTDELGSGIFYGMGSFILFISIIGMCQALAKRMGRNRPAKASVKEQGLNVSRSPQWLSGVLVGIVLFLFGVFFDIGRNTRCRRYELAGPAFLHGRAVNFLLDSDQIYY